MGGHGRALAGGEPLQSDFQGEGVGENERNSTEMHAGLHRTASHSLRVDENLPWGRWRKSFAVSAAQLQDRLALRVQAVARRHSRTPATRAVWRASSREQSGLQRWQASKELCCAAALFRHSVMLR